MTKEEVYAHAWARVRTSGRKVNKHETRENDETILEDIAILVTGNCEKEAEEKESLKQCTE